MLGRSPDLRVNVCFHGIGRPRIEREPGESRYWITADQLKRILDALIARPEVSISFDDGNRSDIDVALNHLVERRLEATFFPLAGRLSDRDSLSPAGVRELVDAGMAVGSHGMWHRPWRRLTKSEADEELRQARDVITDAAGQSINRAAVPLGQYDRRSLAMLRRHRYTEVNTSDRRVARSGHWLQPRFSVQADETPESLDSDIAHASTLLARARLAAVGQIKKLG
jgi:peptidoglycan/xylan/chitin deacetylase (PgdA/CDA1 family)